MTTIPSSGPGSAANSAEAPEDSRVPIREGVDPLTLFDEWYAQAEKAEPNDPSAVALATVDAGGLPNVRMVLLKGYDARGFVFYTNVESRKGEEIAAHPVAALCFHWKSLRCQVRLRGPMTLVSTEEADAYFATRPKHSQIGAWASRQSRPVKDRFELEREVAKFAVKHAFGRVPRPDFWSGYRLAPLEIEFWKHKPFRLHERLLFTRRTANDTSWTTERLFP